MKITVALLRDLEKQVYEEKISYSRMVEILNETAAMPELHPAITHVNASPEFFANPDNVKALNKMAELAYNSTDPALKSVEVCEIGQIKVSGIVKANIIDAAKECIYLASLLKVAVQLYWNGKHIDIYRGTTTKQIIEKATNK